MKVFENKSILKKIVIVLLCVMLLSFCVPKSVDAIDAEGIGGKLLSPVMSLLVALGDGAMSLLEKVVLQNETALINIDTSSSMLSKIIVGFISVAVLACAIASVVVTGGGTLTVLLGVAKSVITIGGVAVITFPITTPIVEEMLPASFYLPLYSVTPQEIFSNKVPLLDVDFFNPESQYVIENKYEVKSKSVIEIKLEELKKKNGFTSMDETYSETKTNISGYPYKIYKWEYNGYTYQLNATSRIS